MSTPRIDNLLREYLDDGVDVTSEPDRALILRAINLSLRHDAELRKLSEDVTYLKARADSMRPRLESIPEQAEVAAKRIIDKRELTIYRWIAGAGLAAVLGELALRLFSMHH